MAVQPNLLPSHSEKTLGAMKAERTVKRITFNPSEANPGETLYVSVPKLSEHEVIVAGSLALVFNIVLTGDHANNYLVQNVSRALVDKLAVKFAATTIQDTDGYDIYKIFEDLFLSTDERANMLSKGIQSVDLCKIRSGAGDTKTSGVDAETKLETIYKNKYRINLEHQILTDHGVFYPQALYNDLIFELTLAPASQVVRGSDPNKLMYKLENIQLEYETIRNKSLADEATSTFTNGKEFAYDLVMRDRVVPVNKGADTRLNIRVNPQRRSLKGILLLFITPYTAGTRDSENYLNPDITKGKVTANGVPNRVYNEGISGTDMWKEVARFFGTHTRTRVHGAGSHGRPNMDLTKYLDIPAKREKLAILVSTGKSKVAIGVRLAHEQVRRLSDKDVAKYSKRQEAYIGSKTKDLPNATAWPVKQKKKAEAAKQASTSATAATQSSAATPTQSRDNNTESSSSSGTIVTILGIGGLVVSALGVYYQREAIMQRLKPAPPASALAPEPAAPAPSRIPVKRGVRKME